MTTRSRTITVVALAAAAIALLGITGCSSTSTASPAVVAPTTITATVTTTAAAAAPATTSHTAPVRGSCAALATTGTVALNDYAATMTDDETEAQRMASTPNHPQFKAFLAQMKATPTATGAPRCSTYQAIVDQFRNTMLAYSHDVPFSAASKIDVPVGTGYQERAKWDALVATL